MLLPYKPTKVEIQAAEGRTLPDVIAKHLKVLFCGINPSLYSAAVGHHFARPGNRFWPTLHASGFTPRLFSPFEDQDLLQLGYGLTNVVDRATATADQLAAEEFVEGGRKLATKVEQFHPEFVAILGITAYRAAFNQPKAKAGLQPDKIHDAQIWVLPNPSGLNAHYQLKDLAALFQELLTAVKNS